jgi:opacity protein-like surface antigen
MKRLMFLFLISFTIIVYSTLQGQNLKGKFALSGTGGVGFPLGDFSDKEKGRAQTGYGLGGNLEYFIIDILSLGINLRYQRFGMYVKDLEKDFIEFVHDSIPQADTSGIDIDSHKSIIHLGIFGKYHFFISSNLSPYIKIGAGWGKLKGFADQPGYIVYPESTYTIESTADASYDGDLYIDVGGGVLYLFSDKVSICGEILFTHLSTDGTWGTVKTKMQVDGEHQAGEEKKSLDYNSSYLNLFVTLSYFF